MIKGNNMSDKKEKTRSYYRKKYAETWQIPSEDAKRLPREFWTSHQFTLEVMSPAFVMDAKSIAVNVAKILERAKEIGAISGAATTLEDVKKSLDYLLEHELIEEEKL
jgi:hypothetical protein